MVTKKQVEDVSVDTAEGMAWWNNMSERGRADALNTALCAGYLNPSPADAWHAHRRGLQSVDDSADSKNA